MESRPVIGIAAETLEQIPDQLYKSWLVGQGYVHALTNLGAVPWIIPLLPDDEATLEAIYQRLDGVFLMGGLDIDPSSYGEERHPLCGKTDPPRDWTEMQLIRWALCDSKPVLGVCRGIQMMNVACGGTLYQDVPAHLPDAIQHDELPPASNGKMVMPFHPVRVEPRSQLAAMLGADEVLVNSLHHQGIKGLAPGLAASAFAQDGLIEGIEGKGDHYFVGVQWHPEDMGEKGTPMRQLFQSFLAAALLARSSSPRTPLPTRGKGWG